MTDLPPTPNNEIADNSDPSAQKIRPAPEDILTAEERRASTEQPGPPVALAPPLHILAALVTVVLDWVWFMVELPATLSIAFLPALLPLILALGGLDFVAVTLVQHYLAREEWGKASAKGVVMAIVAGVPYPVFGTAIGVPLAAWAGIREIQKWLGPK